MRIKNLISILVLFSLLTACQLTVAPPPTQPSGVDAVGTAVELTTVAKFTEIASSAMPPITATFTAIPTPTLTPDSAGSVPVSGPCDPTVTASVNANVRSGPSTAYDTVGSLMLGQTATIVGRNDAYTWWYIAYPGVSGGYAWIAGSVVTSACVPSVVQVVAAPPLPTQEVVVADSSSNDADNADNSESEPAEFLLLQAVAFGADLVPAGMSVSPNPATQHEEVQVRVGVKNEGNAASGSFTIQWWASSAILGCEWTVSSLAPGESVNRSCAHTYGGWSVGYNTRLVIDSGNAVAEINEDNNVMARTLKVTKAP
jgi:hypothetical protein